MCSPRNWNESSIRAALKAGHAFVAHDWMCDTTGFQFTATDSSGKQVALMGDAVKRIEGLKLTAKLPVPAYVPLIAHGYGSRQGRGQIGF